MEKKKTRTSNNGGGWMTPRRGPPPLPMGTTNFGGGAHQQHRNRTLGKMSTALRMNRNAATLLLILVSAMLMFFLFTMNSKIDKCSMAKSTDLVEEQMAMDVRETEASKRNIVVFVVAEKAEDYRNEYQLAHQTLRCYCAMRNYPLVVKDFASNATLARLCPQKDYMFRRHCALAHWLADHPLVEWVFFVDADMAVVNPDHLVEEYLPAGGDDLVFYERIFNGEIAAGAYLVRNTEFSAKFLFRWTEHYGKLGLNGSDNVALHAVLIDNFCGKKPGIECSKRRSVCWQHWRTHSENEDELRMFTECVRSILGKRNQYLALDGTGSVQIRTNFREHWARDSWLSGSKWCHRDFLLHGWKKRLQNSPSGEGWRSPFLVGEQQLGILLDPERCAAEGAALKWPYDPSMVAATPEVDQLLAPKLHGTRMKQLDYWRRVEEYEQSIQFQQPADPVAAAPQFSAM